MKSKRNVVYFGYYDNDAHDSSTKIGKTEYLYGRNCTYNTSHPFKDFKVYILIELEKAYLDEMEQICLEIYDHVKARHSSEYSHRNCDNEWIMNRPTRDDIERRLADADVPFEYKILSEEEIAVVEREFCKNQDKQQRERKMKKIVVDTDIIIDYLRQPRKATLFKKLTQDKTLKIILPAVSLTELYVGKGAAKPKEEARLKRAVGKTKLVPADKDISKRAGILIRNYSNLYLADALVAATSLEEKAHLCTFNKAHFEKISSLKLFNYEKLTI